MCIRDSVERERLVLLPVVEHDGIVFSGTLAEVLAHRQAQVTATVVVTAARDVNTPRGCLRAADRTSAEIASDRFAPVIAAMCDQAESRNPRSSASKYRPSKVFLM